MITVFSKFVNIFCGNSYFICKNFWSYGCSVLHNAAFNLKRHCEVVNKHNISLEKLSDSAHLPTNLQFAFQNDSELDVPYILNFCGEELEFHDEFLFNSLAKLSSQRLRIVILYYCFDKTDKEISSILQIPSRRSVQYHRQQAIIQLRHWIKEMEDFYALL